jgi:hypothetical protein
VTDDDIDKIINSENEADADNKFVESVTQKLMERFSSVQIFAVKYKPGDGNETVGVSSGNGDWYSRIGYIKEWVIRQDEYIKNNVRQTGEN